MKNLIFASILIASVSLTANITKNTIDNRWIMARIDEELKGQPNAKERRQELFKHLKRRFAMPEKL